MLNIYVMFDTERAMDVEHDIAPPMKFASTIPIQAGRGPKNIEGLVLYIGMSPFLPAIDEKTFREAVEKVVAQLEAREG